MKFKNHHATRQLLVQCLRKMTAITKKSLYLEQQLSRETDENKEQQSMLNSIHCRIDYVCRWEVSKIAKSSCNALHINNQVRFGIVQYDRMYFTERGPTCGTLPSSQAKLTQSFSASRISAKDGHGDRGLGYCNVLAVKVSITVISGTCSRRRSVTFHWSMYAGEHVSSQGVTTAHALSLINTKPTF